MPANVVDISNAKGHYTKAEKNARISEQKNLTRASVKLVEPKHVKSDDAAHEYWKTTTKRMKGITLLDDLDSETLAMYCQILSRRDYLSAQWRQLLMAADEAESVDERIRCLDRADEILKRLESQERLALQYAEKLGLTPSGRVRLAKRRAEERPVDPEADLYGDGG